MMFLVVGDSSLPAGRRPFLKPGVADYLCRPLDLSHLTYLIEMNTIEIRVRSSHKAEPKAQGNNGLQSLPLNHDGSFYYMNNEPMADLLLQLQRVASLDTTILLTGETGTGKTQLAAVIHKLSPRGTKPFKSIDCGTLPPQLIESEMFGHVKGAFTGADANRLGIFASAADGTLFLDEIDALPPSLQIKLLRVVEYRIFHPVGSDKQQTLAARLVVASNQPLEREVEAGRFRADLYFRLSVVSFDVPPLRQRRPLVPALAQRFLDDFGQRFDRPINVIDGEAMLTLKNYSWPGNIRELRNLIERAVALSTGPQLTVNDLPAGLNTALMTEHTPYPTPTTVHCENDKLQDRPLRVSREFAEQECITKALAQHKNNRQRAAADLGISRMTL